MMLLYAVASLTTLRYPNVIRHSLYSLLWGLCCVLDVVTVVFASTQSPCAYVCC